MAELSWAGTSIGDTTGCASTRPNACPSGTRPCSVTGRNAAKTRARASSTLSSWPEASGEGPSWGMAGERCLGVAGLSAAEEAKALCIVLHIAPHTRPRQNRASPMNTLAESLQLALHLILEADAALWRIVALSLQVSATACAIGAGVGLLLGAWLAVTRAPGHRLLVWAVNTLLALPSVVVGLLVYLLLSRSGPLGSWGLLFTPTAMVIAQSILVVPLIAALTRRLVLEALEEGGEQLRSLGAGPMTSALLTLLLSAFGRAIAEVGAVMIVGGNIQGVTRVMTTTIALETSKGDLPMALALGTVLLGVVGLLNGLIALLPGHDGVRRGVLA